MQGEKMSYKNGNYTAFYVDEPFVDGRSVVTAPDFCYYNLLKAWNAGDSNFHFVDSHEKTYQVRDGSDFIITLVPRIRERLGNSKNIILFLSSHTKQSRALKEEIEYGALELGLPIIVVYPELSKNSEIHKNYVPTERVCNLIEAHLPILKKAMGIVPTAHVLLNKSNINASINYDKLTVNGKEDTCFYGYKDEE